jgi:hypothetical protein
MENRVRTNNPEIKSLVNDVVLSVNESFGNERKAIYIMGSLARGGFSEVASDIDIGIILAGDLGRAETKIDDIRSEIVSSYPSVKNNVSIFWGSIESINGLEDAGRYPPFDRLDLIDHAVLLSGDDVRDQLIRPSRKELEIASAAFSIDYLGTEERIEEFYNCDRIVSKGAVYTTKTILFPARFIYLARTGEIAGNDVSYEYYLANFSGPDANLIERGYRWRLDSLPANLDETKNLLESGLIPLYSNFIDVYIDRMESYGATEIREKLEKWKESITRPSI